MWTVVVVDDEKNFCTLLSEYIHALAPRFQVAACFQDGGRPGIFCATTMWTW